MIDDTALAEDRARQLLAWDDELLLGGVMLSEWSTFLVQDADRAFCAGADLAALLVAQAAMESHLRYEYVDPSERAGGFADLIERSPLQDELKTRLHEIRQARNR